MSPQDGKRGKRGGPIQIPSRLNNRNVVESSGIIFVIQKAIKAFHNRQSRQGLLQYTLLQSHKWFYEPEV